MSIYFKKNNIIGVKCNIKLRLRSKLYDGKIFTVEKLIKNEKRKIMKRGKLWKEE